MNGPRKPVALNIQSETDIVLARTAGKEMAHAMGFGLVDQTRIATGISELARNILQYARRGHIRLEAVNRNGRQGLEILAEDNGPGIANVRSVLEGSHHSHKGLGLGIPGTRRLMDEFDLTSEPGGGTRVRCVKWL